ncbi:MAG: bifunctional DNA-formamidopyrimidine glycosylase/DNA-(apurinic or apyrimidinic site) lyase [Candidatus Moranbacteria bacterium]|nr:bifunctional DNA-formamidopyrimidine glycosylase/DNA-(apurinic or apyrimidinic site) lyase [Candidatus Moranbacteria bacterium]
MPELPEVQTVVNDLNKKIIGYTIVDFWSDWKNAIKNLTFVSFQKNIKNKKILNVRRIGKNIFIDLSDGWTLYIHLKMTGHLLIKDNKKISEKEQENFSERVNQYVHHIWFLDKNSNKDKSNCQMNLEFSDLRKFAKIVLMNTEEIENLPEIKALGIDAMDRKFNFKKFQEILEKRPKSLIGIILMNQNLIAGIGNIYRSEILFEAGVHPERKIGDLNVGEMRNIFDQIKIILKKAIRMRGTSDSDYRDTSGGSGRFQNILKVYRLDGGVCSKCGKGEIERIKMAQRSVFYCGECQK